MDLTFRRATSADAEAAVPLIYSSGPTAFDYVFSHPARGTQPVPAARETARPPDFLNQLVDKPCAPRARLIVNR